MVPVEVQQRSGGHRTVARCRPRTGWPAEPGRPGAPSTEGLMSEGIPRLDEGPSSSEHSENPAGCWSSLEPCPCPVNPTAGPEPGGRHAQLDVRIHRRAGCPPTFSPKRRTPALASRSGSFTSRPRPRSARTGSEVLPSGARHAPSSRTADAGENRSQHRTPKFRYLKYEAIRFNIQGMPLIARPTHSARLERLLRTITEDGSGL